MQRLIPVWIICLIILGGGCVERTLTITSNPPGALVFLNDQEAGRTPFTKRFVWYGYYDVQVRKEGYQTLKVTTPVIAPWWQWVPFDFVAELVPVKLQDPHEVYYRLQRHVGLVIDPDAIVDRAEDLRDRLESSRFRTPATQPATQPTTHSTK
jgi:hypothetical protein